MPTSSQQSQLTDAQHTALGRTRAKTGVPVSGPRRQPDGSRQIPAGHIGPQTANVLIAAGFAQMVEGTLRATREGRREFDKPRPEGPGTFLDVNPARPLTHSPHRAVRDEPEVMAAPSPDWAQHAELIRTACRKDADAMRLSGLAHPEERLAELRRLAAERGIDVKDEMRRVNHSVKVLERKVRRDEAA